MSSFQSQARPFLTNNSRTIPFLRPAPPRLSEHIEELRQLEASGIFSNFGPINTRFESEIKRMFFGNTGAVTTVSNATLGLMLAIKAVTEGARGKRYALMPSFTFAATAHAAIWAGFEPLFCDIDFDTWLPSHKAQEDLIAKFGKEIAVVVPYAAFGSVVDLDFYESLGFPIVIDAAASLGTLDKNGLGFGSSCRYPVVYSLHVTKTFSTSEGGLVYCDDEGVIETIRIMSNFGFGEPRVATMAGLNAKMCEIAALVALLKLKDIESSLMRREVLFHHYTSTADALVFQKPLASRQAHQFVPALIPEGSCATVDDVRGDLLKKGVGSAAYFSPHLAEHPYFRSRSTSGPLPVTDKVSARILSLPLSDIMSNDDIDYICTLLKQSLEARH